MPSLLRDGEVENLRSELELWFEDTCDIYTDTRSQDNYGGESDSYTLSASAVPCLIVPGTSVGHRPILETAGALRLQQLYTISVPYGTVVKAGDRLVITSQDNLTLRAQVVMQPESIEIELQIVANLDL